MKSSKITKPLKVVLNNINSSNCFIFGVILAIAFLVACGKPRPKTFTVGIINLTSSLDVVVDGFKDGMAESGYVEGENIAYIYEGATESIEALGPAIQRLIEAKPDLIFSVTTPATILAKQAVEEIDTPIPIVFCPMTDPVDAGVVDNLRNPGGNITGVKVGGHVQKQVEWLLKIVPGVKGIFVPYNPNDKSGTQGLIQLQEIVAKLGVEILVRETPTSKDIKKATTAIPEEAGAILMLPDNLILTYTHDFAKAGIKHSLPTVSLSIDQAEAGALIGYGFDNYSIGKQSARLAGQILKGTKPGDLPVETADFFLTINLKTAKAIGLDIPNNILHQADNIIY